MRFRGTKNTIHSWRGLLRPAVSGWRFQISIDESFRKPDLDTLSQHDRDRDRRTIRSHPLDGVVLMGGCDKSTPGLTMSAISASIPFIFPPAGPMLRGNYAGRSLGSGSDAWEFWDERRAGKISSEEWVAVEGGFARSYGHCMTMGTSSTMTAIAEAMGLILPGASSTPAADAGHKRMSASCGRRIVDMVRENLTPDKIITPAAVRNAVTVAMATGCSTNAVVHLLAMARRAGVKLDLDNMVALGDHAAGREYPAGRQRVSVEDFSFAGGLRALMHQLGDKLDRDAITCTGRPVWERIEGAPVYKRRRDPSAVGRPIRFFITAGQVSDYTGARALMGSLPSADWLLGARGNDANWFREDLLDKEIIPCIPRRKSRDKPVRYDKRRD